MRNQVRKFVCKYVRRFKYSQNKIIFWVSLYGNTFKTTACHKRLERLLRKIKIMSIYNM